MSRLLSITTSKKSCMPGRGAHTCYPITHRVEAGEWSQLGFNRTRTRLLKQSVFLQCLEAYYMKCSFSTHSWDCCHCLFILKIQTLSFLYVQQASTGSCIGWMVGWLTVLSHKVGGTLQRAAAGPRKGPVFILQEQLSEVFKRNQHILSQMFPPG